MNHFNFNTDLDYARDQDANDELGHFRSKFHLPEDKNGYSCIYNVSPRKRVKPAADPKAGQGLGSTR